MAAELDPPVSGGGRGRRARRTVITDDSYGGDGYLERDSADPALQRAPTAPALEKARAAAARTKSATRTAPQTAAPEPRASTGKVVWRLAALATFMWLGGVLAFAVGFFQLPLEPLDALPRAAMTLPPHLLLMTSAVALAPLGLIWLTALSARRADALRAETQELAARLGGGLGGAGGGGDRDLGGAESALERAREKLQQEREALQALLEEIEGGASRVAGAGAAPEKRRGVAAPSSERATVGLEPKSMLAGAGRPAQDVADEDDLDEDAEEFTPALGVERSAPSASPPRVKIGEGPAQGNGRGRRQLEEIDRLKARVEGGRGGSPAAKSAAAASAASSSASSATASPRAGGGALDWGKLIAAANFPESEEDQETLDALYAVLTDSETAALLQAAEDALSGLADIGLFMEDMQPHHAPTDLWRSYVIDGKKTDIMDIGGIRDPHAIEDTSEALRSKPDFNKVSERFMSRYEAMVERLFSEAPEPTMAVELADTRTGRAFMLLARASGRLG